MEEKRCGNMGWVEEAEEGGVDGGEGLGGGGWDSSTGSDG